MAQTGYREPNVYTTTTRVTPTVPETPVDMYPLVIGTGIAISKRTDVGKTVNDSFEPFQFEEKVSLISRAYVVDEWGEETEISSDYYTLEEVDGVSTLAWVANDDGTIKASVDGIISEGSTGNANSVVYFDYTAEAGEDHYTLQRFTLTEDIEDFYGADIIDGTINNISLGAQIAKNAGSPVVYVLQVKHEEGGDLKTEYLEALEENVVDLAAQPIWRIQAVDGGVDTEDIVKAIRRYVNEMSLPEERSEKYAGVTCPIEDNMRFEDANVDGETVKGIKSTFEEFIAKLGNYRLQTFYPTNAMYTFSDGTEQKVGGEFIACAYAGFEQTLERKSQSATNSSIPAGIFNLIAKEAKNTKLKRAQKNAIAALGVTLLTQQTEYGAINVRDALSMDMSTYQVQDPCVTMAADFTAKTLRRTLGVYIGKYNINPETISKVRATADTTLAGLVQDKVIKSYGIVSLEQDTDNPQCLVMHIKVGVLYPLKEIDINIVLD